MGCESFPSQLLLEPRPFRRSSGSCETTNTFHNKGPASSSHQVNEIMRPEARACSLISGPHLAHIHVKRSVGFSLPWLARMITSSQINLLQVPGLLLQ